MIANERASSETYKSKFLAHSGVPFKSYEANTDNHSLNIKVLLSLMQFISVW
jgi:hypothetical protein